MKTWLSNLLFAVLLFCVVPDLAADGFSVGTVLDGYTFRDGFWWKGETPHTLSRSKVWTSHCSYYYRNNFHPAAVYHAPIAKPYVPPAKADHAPKGWREKLLELKEAQVAFEQKQKNAARDHQEYMEAIKALGLDDHVDPVYSGYKLSKIQSVYAPNAGQGNTVYGYSLNTVGDVYGQNDVSVWMQQYGRAQQQAQTVAEKGLDGMLEALKLEGDNRARVATILAKAQLLKSLDVAETRTQTTVEVQQTGTATAGDGSAINAQPFMAAGDGLYQMLKARCYNCHSPEGQNGISGKSELFPSGVDLSKYDQFSLAQKQRTIQSVLSGEMPQGGNGLSVEEMGLLYADLLSSGQTPKQPAKAD